jgi:hypothetical protein
MRAIQRAIQIARSGLVTLVILALAQGFALNVAAQTVYKSVDDQGSVIYTDRPTVDQLAERVAGLDIVLTNSGAITGQNDEARKQHAAENVAKQIRQDQDAEKAVLQAKTNEERAANCEVANQRLTKYSEAHRLYREASDGEREYLTDDELDSARTKAARSVDEWCG